MRWSEIKSSRPYGTAEDAEPVDGTLRGNETRLSSYQCTVVVESPIAGDLESIGRVTLGNLPIVSSKLAVRWLRHQALRIADGRTYPEVTDPAGDGPAELRAWADDPTAQQLARHELAVTGRMRLTVRDSSGHYWLTAQRLADVPAPQPTGAGSRPVSHRRHPRHGRTRRAAAG